MDGVGLRQRRRAIRRSPQISEFFEDQLRCNPQIFCLFGQGRFDFFVVIVIIYGCTC